MLEVNGVKVEYSYFPDGTLNLNGNTFEKANLETSNDIIIYWQFERNEELFMLQCVVDYIREITKAEISLVMPYIPNARMDRVKNKGDIFTLKTFAKMINYMEFDPVMVLDPHSEVSETLIKNLIKDDVDYYITKAIKMVRQANMEKTSTDLILYFPDAGAMKRYSKNFPEYKYLYGEKIRNWETGKIEGLTLKGDIDITGKNVLIIDDICSKGGTFYYGAKALKKAGAKDIYLYVTHCEKTIEEGVLLDDEDLITHIYTTDSLKRFEHPKITTMFY